MALIDSVPTTRVTKPTFLNSAQNGKLDPAWLRSFDGSTSTAYKLFLPVSYAMQAMHIAALQAGFHLKTTGRYRTYERQEALFRERYRTYDTGSGSTKWWQGRTWWKLKGVAMAATPGTSNHGFGLADDLAQDENTDNVLEGLSDADLTWVRDNGWSFGWGLEQRAERWHWHWYHPANPNALPQRVVDTLYAKGVTVPDLSAFQFTAPKPTAASQPTVITLPPDTEISTPVGDSAMKLGATDASTIIPGVANEGRVTWLQAVLGAPRTHTYDKATLDLVAAFQRNRGGLTVDGQYGPMTSAALKQYRGR
jgi:hypothetical protein